MASMAASKTFHQEVWREITLHKRSVEEGPKTSRAIRRLKKELRVTQVRTAYCWFFVLSVLECINPSHDFRLLVPFLALLLLQGVKSLLSRRDTRHRLQSHALYTVSQKGELRSLKAEELRVGDFVCLKNDDIVPADIVLLASGRSDHSCLVDIFPFVGTSRVQAKAAVRETQRIIKAKELDEAYARLSKLQGTVKVMQPSMRVDQFRGLVKLKGYPVAARLNLDNLVLKGCRLITTPWVFGLVVYAGKDSKSEIIAHNTHVEKLPVSTRLLTRLVLIIAAVAILLAAVNTALAAPNHWVLQFLWMVQLYGQAAPASAFLMLEAIRGVQTYLLHLEMSAGALSIPFQNSNAVETFGGVNYVFLDKSGTITTNQLRSKVILIGKRDFWGCDLPEDMHRSVCLSTSSKLPADLSTQSRRHVHHSQEPTTHILPNVTCGYSDLSEKLSDPEYFRFCEALMLCSSITMSASGEVTCSSKYDDALFRTAQALGLTLVEKSASNCHFHAGSADWRYTTIAVMDYKPQMQRMRLLAQRTGATDGLLLLKGTVDVTKKLLQVALEDQRHYDNCLLELTKRNLKTIVFAGRVVPSEELADVVALLEAAKGANNLHRKEEHIFRDLERNCQLIAIVGLEDPVRPGVPEAISEMTAAGVNVWMLSGDSEETALSTSGAVGLLPEGMTIVPLKGLGLESDCKIELIQQVRTHILGDSGTFNISRMGSIMSDDGISAWEVNVTGREQTPRSVGSPLLHRFTNVQHKRMDSLELQPRFSPDEYAVIMDGLSFSTALREPDSRELLATILCCAKTVVCFSMFPHQKALLVRLVKENFTSSPTTLAIGDAENDIPMLQTAEVGIAVDTKSNAKVQQSCEVTVLSPTSVPQMMAAGYLVRERLAQAVAEWMYVVVTPMCLSLWYTYLCGYSGTEVASLSLWVLYSVESACLVLVQSLFGFDLPELNLPSLGEIYPIRKPLGKRLIRAVLSAFLHSIVTFGFILSGSLGVFSGSTGFTESFSALGGALFLSCSWTTLLHIALTSIHTPPVLVFTTFVLMGTAVYGAFQMMLETSDECGFYAMFTSPGLILGEMGAILASLTLSYLEREYRTVFHPGRLERVSSHKVFPEIVITERSDHLARLASLYKDSDFWLKQQENSAYDCHAFWLTFQSPVIEHEFLQIAATFQQRLQIVCLFAVCLMVYVVYEMAEREFEVGRLLFYVLAAGVVVGMGFVRLSPVMCLLVLTVITAGKFALEILNQTEEPASFVFPALYSLAFTLTWKHHAVLMLWNFVTVAVTIALFEGSASQSDLHVAGILTAALLYYCSLSVLVYNNESDRRKEFRLMKLTENNLERSKDILGCLFPSFVIENVVKGQMPVVMEESLVTILFIDICDFDVICSMHSPRGLTSVLDDLSKKLDDICDSHGLAKIETVGKTFLACAGLVEQETELGDEMARVPPARRAINMALEVLHTFQFITLRHGPLQVNIGISSGPVIAGVVGFNKPQFALVGDTVNTASRMSSTAPAPCSIQITQNTYNLLGRFASGLKIESRTVDVKGKGEMTTYLVKDFDDSSISRRGRSGSVVFENSFYTPQVHRKQRDSKATLLAKLGYWTFADLFSRKDTEVVRSVRWTVSVKTDSPKQQQFSVATIAKHRKLIVIGLVLLVGAYVFQTAHLVAEFIENNSSHLWPHCINISVSVGLLLATRFLLSSRILPWALVASSVALFVSGSFTLDLNAKVQELSTIAVLSFLLVYTLVFGGLFFRHGLIVVAADVLVLGISLYEEDHRVHRLEIGVVLLPVVAVGLSFLYSREMHMRIYTNLEHAAEKEISRTERLLMQMMPVHVYESLLQEERITDELKGVTLLFADIVGFTALSSQKTPNEMVHLLSNLFTRFDRLCVKNHVYKVHTIGDCYVAMGYTGSRQGRDFEEECLSIVSQACDMLEVIRCINEEMPEVNLNMRIGVHTSTGVVTAGITGAKIVRYDIFGPDVLVANKMESNGVPGEILISDSTKEMLEHIAPDIYSFEEKGLIEVPSVKRSHVGFFLRTKSLPEL